LRRKEDTSYTFGLLGLTRHNLYNGESAWLLTL
jgi:hypothetical protein